VLDQPALGHLGGQEPLENIWTLPLGRSEDGRPIARISDTQALELPVLPASVPPRADRVMVSLAASEVILATDRPTGISARNVLTGRIDHVGRQDGLAWVRVNVGVPLLAHVTTRTVEELKLSEGDEVFAVIKTTSLQVIGP
jgi:molybdopterin-binding protein